MYACMCSCGYTYYVMALCVRAVACMWISEDSLWAWVLSFCPVGPRDQTQADMLDSKCLYSLSSHWAQEDTTF